MAEPSDPRVAVYIDFDNIVISRYDEVYGRGKFMADKARYIGGSKADPVDDPAAASIVDVGAILDYATSFGSVVISRAFADWSAPANSRYASRLVDRAVDLTQLFPTAAYTKNGADIRLSVDVMEDMFRLPDITHIVIVAGDSDFIPLAQRAKRLGRFVIGIGVAGATSKQLAAACDVFKFYDELPGIKPIPARQEPQKNGSSKHASAAAPSKIQEIGKNQPSAFEDIDAEGDVDEGPGTAPTDRKAAATDLLIRAMRIGHEKSDDEWLHSSSTKIQMLRMDPSFNEKSLGFKTFSDFLKSRGTVVEMGKGDEAGRIKLRENATDSAA